MGLTEMVLPVEGCPILLLHVLVSRHELLHNLCVATVGSLVESEVAIRILSVDISTRLK